MHIMQRKLKDLKSSFKVPKAIEKVEKVEDKKVPKEENPTSTLLFHTRVLINDKLCLLVIDDMNCTNLVSTSLVKRLNLKTIRHPQPYKLDGKVRINKQVLVKFSIRDYHEEVLCDIAPMQTAHVLLGKPWINQRNATHCKRRNRYSFIYNSRRIALTPLSDLDVSNVQLFMKRESEKSQEDTKEKDVSNIQLLFL